MLITTGSGKTVLFEHRFWLQVLGDHSRFILNALAPSELEHIQQAQYFIKTFDDLLQRSREQLREEDVNDLSQKAYLQAQALRQFKLLLLKLHLIGNIKIELPPTFLNHMLNELEEYIRVLHCYLVKQVPSFHPVHQHLLWLLDASGHATAISNHLDDTEMKTIKQSMRFSKDFKELYLKTVEFAGYLRTNLVEFPALSKLNKDAELEICLFMGFLKELEGLQFNKQVLGILTPLLLDHMFREECYYLHKLSEVSDVKKPDCDPGKPRADE